ncbi:MAG: ABC transporter substrate binding protein [Chloroflexota bacterium]|nr:ABC transporter substrate binding protein [Chloroflexota bacterium]
MYRRLKHFCHADRPGQDRRRAAGSLSSRLPLIAALLLLLAAPFAVAADDDKPTVAFLRFGQSPSFALTDMAVLDMLEVYGFISAEERDTLEGDNDLRGENINILYRDAGFDFPTANIMVEDALDEGADVFLTVSTQVGMIALGAMSDIEDPPALIFAIVTEPYSTGLAAATCIKPPNVTGTLMHFDYEEYTNIIYMQDPDFQIIGVLANADDPASADYVSSVELFGERFGFTVEVATVVTAADYAPGTDALIDKNVDAIALPPRTGSSGGVPAIVDAAYDVPVFSSLVSDVIHGVTIAAGFEGWYREGQQAARMLIAYLEGNLDIATTAVASTPGFAVAVNLDSAEAQGVVIADKLLARADYIVEGGAGAGVTIEIPGEIGLAEMTLEERRAEDAAFLANLHCSPDMIAEQLSALPAEDQH